MSKDNVAESILSEHAADIRKFLRKPAGAAFLAWIDSISPSHSFDSIPANDRLHGATVFVNEQAGHTALRNKIRALLDPAVTADEPKDKFSDPEIE